MAGRLQRGRITNLTGGTISGGNGIAIRAGGAVANAGTIIGDVDLSSRYGNVYYANGGRPPKPISFWTDC